MKVFTKQRLALLVFFITSSVFLAQTSAQVVFTDDFESGISNWEVTGAWGITDEYAYSPDNSLTDSPGGIYLPDQEIFATMANGVDLSDPSILSADVSWWMIMDIENGNFDYLYVEVSDDDFSTFTQIASFFGEGMLDPWIEYTYPLGSLLGSDNVKVRFHFSSDAGYEVDGCYIDDFSIVTSDIDEAPPEIFFDAPFAYEGSLGDYVVDAEILDASGVASAEVEYTVDGAVQPNVIGANTGGDSWEFTIPQQDPGYQVDFVIIAIDASPNANEAVTDTASYIAGEYIGYDNAVVDFYTSIAAPGGTAVVFTIEDPSQLVTALIRNYTDQSQPPNDEMVVHIWSDGGNGPGVDLIDPIAIMPEANLVHTRAFTRIDLRPYAAQLSSLQGDIFVGFTVPSGIVLTTISQPVLQTVHFPLLMVLPGIQLETTITTGSLSDQV
ncbi:MAG: immune inhibitor A [Bacteroidales bacterium]|nr:immune inhibitor A [Bacteroidales bacterium]